MTERTAAESRAAVPSRRTTDLLDVTVLMGGPSAEREVSLMSGEAVAAALTRGGHRVRRADISPRDVSALDRKDIDVVFIALHGEFGESGEVQELCELRSLPYTGAGPRASRIGLDKAASKQLFKQAGLATPDWMIIEEFHTPQTYRPWLEEFSLPVVVKPVTGGSSVDVTIARDEETRDTALDELLDRYGRTLVEKYVPGRELTVGILGTQALPVLEVIPAGEFYDLHAKYDDDAGTQYVFDHGLGDRLTRHLQRDALTAHEAVGCRDLSRVDFVLAEDGTPQVLEINTIPGFTSHSLLPMAAARVGIDFDELVDRLVRMAADR